MQAFAPCMTVDTERRKKLRNRPRSLVYVELESANGGMMRDLSEEGFALRAMMPLRAGGKTQFAFSLDEGTRISGEGRIVWIKEDGRVAGIEFCGISHSARVQIRRWLNRADQPAGRGPKVPAIAVAEPP
ncbi:MAG: PilZ domain-containing protein, partial [Candidatus Acidiferrum sp.]